LTHKPGGPTVADWAIVRCAISRSYYAAYGLCLVHLRQKEPGYRPPLADSHTAVIDKLKDDRTGQLKGIASQLANLKKTRRLADYDARHTFTLSDCKSHLLIAKSVVDRLNALIN